MRPLRKFTITVWTELEDHELSLEELGHEVDSGNAYCSKMESEVVEDPSLDPDWDETEFFGLSDEDED